MNYQDICMQIWNFLFNTFRAVLIPVVIPCFLYKWLMSLDSKTNRDMRGKVVLITGASSGLGEQLAHVFYRAGCKVILAARRLHQLHRVRAQLLAIKTKTTTFAPHILHLDLSDLASLPKKAQEALEFCGQVDILINNGGISFRGEILQTTVEVDMKVMLVNYFGQITLTKALLPSMIEKKQGHIAVISSVQGKISLPYSNNFAKKQDMDAQCPRRGMGPPHSTVMKASSEPPRSLKSQMPEDYTSIRGVEAPNEHSHHRSAYGASKHAVQAFFDCLRSEVAHHGIQVTVVSPGYINTDLSFNALTGSGHNYGVMDETTSKGYDAKEVAQKIMRAISQQDKDLIIAPITPRIAVFLRHFFPTLFFYLMKRRAQKEG